MARRRPDPIAPARCRLNRIEFYPLDNPAVEERAFRAGQLHVTAALPAGLPVSKIPTYRAEAPSRLRTEPLLATDSLVFNTKRPPFDQPAVRRALSLAIDRDAIVGLYEGSVLPARGLTPPNCGGFTMQGAPKDDAALARKLLAEAGFPGGRGFPVVDVLSFTDDNPRRSLEAMQAMWLKELGVHVTITPLEQRVLVQTMQNHDFTFGFMSWVADYTDPTTFLGIFLTGNENNLTGWSNRDYDRLVAEAARTADQSRRFEFSREAEAILLSDPPMVPIVHNAAVHAVQPIVHGWQLNLLGYQRYQDVWLGQGDETMNPKVDAYLRNAEKWRKEMETLRAIALQCGLIETIKWSKPCYMFREANIVIIQEFKESCALLFCRGALLKDTKGILEKPGEHSHETRRIRFTGVREIVGLKPVLKAYLHEAMAAAKAGLKVNFKRKPERIPEELQKKLDEIPALKTAFAVLTPGRQRAYVLYFSGAKQSKTREARVEKCLRQILQGKGLND